MWLEPTVSVAGILKKVLEASGVTGTHVCEACWLNVQCWGCGRPLRKQHKPRPVPEEWRWGRDYGEGEGENGGGGRGVAAAGMTASARRCAAAGRSALPLPAGR